MLFARRMRYSPAATTLVLPLAAALLGLALPATAQNSGSASIKLPETIRLVLRGKVGDAYTYQSSSTSNFDFHFKGAGNEDKQIEKEDEQKTKASRVLSVSPQGNIKVQDSTLSGKKVTEKNGERSTSLVERKAFVDVWSPNNTRLSHTLVPPPVAKSKSAGKKTKSAAPKKPVSDSEEKEPSEAPPFPDKPLRVGDTWTGVIKMLPKTISDSPDLDYTAQLDAIEIHNNIPCAKVKYKLEKTITEMPEGIKSKLPAAAKVTGSISLSGVITEFYSLDRGATIENEGGFNLTIQFTISLTNPNDGSMLELHIDGGGGLSGHDVATAFPAYDASLLDSSK